MGKPMIPFGQRLKALRNERKLMQKDMAKFLHYTTSNYQKMEYGDLNVSCFTLVQLADFFDVSLDYLVGRSDERQRAQ